MGTQCWEYMKCGKENQCPAYPKNGFQCWKVPGTLCRGERQGGYDEKIQDCRVKCDYYQGVISGAIPVAD